ncbi:unnamed protein product, partial [Ilex paraguariensis]
MGSGKHRSKIFFHRSSPITAFRKQKFPREFVCPISGSLMADPVIVSSGHTFERNCVLACKYLSFIPTLPAGCTADFSTIIPNLALKSTIVNWSCSSLHDPPKPIDFHSACKLVQTLMDSQNPKSQRTHFKTRDEKHTQLVKEAAEKNGIAVTKLTDSDTELTGRTSRLSSSSDESVALANGPTTPLPLKTRPSCYSSESSSDIETLNSNSLEEEEFIEKLRSSQVFEQEEAVISLRKLTRTQETARLHLCTPRLLSALRNLITSRYSSIQVNSTAALVNLSLENPNKIKIVRSGIVPPLIDVLSVGFPESQDHAAGALFSLALDDQNKTAIGVLGALPSLLHAIRSDSERTRHDSTLALYHLSLIQSNRVKLVKIGSVPMLLGMVRSGHMTGRVMLILCNLSASVEGRATVLDCGGVECFVGMLSRGEFDSESTRESCVTALYGLSQGGLRFKGLAREAGAEEVLKKVEEIGSERVKEKVRRIMGVMREKDEEEEVDWEELLNSGETGVVDAAIRLEKLREA